MIAPLFRASAAAATDLSRRLFPQLVHVNCPSVAVPHITGSLMLLMLETRMMTSDSSVHLRRHRRYCHSTTTAILVAAAAQLILLPEFSHGERYSADLM